MSSRIVSGFRRLDGQSSIQNISSGAEVARRQLQTLKTPRRSTQASSGAKGDRTFYGEVVDFAGCQDSYCVITAKIQAVSDDADVPLQALRRLGSEMPVVTVLVPKPIPVPQIGSNAAFKLLGVRRWAIPGESTECATSPDGEGKKPVYVLIPPQMSLVARVIGPVATTTVDSVGTLLSSTTLDSLTQYNEHYVKAFLGYEQGDGSTINAGVYVTTASQGQLAPGISLPFSMSVNLTPSAGGYRVFAPVWQ